MKYAIAITLALLVATPLWAGQLHVGGVVAESCGPMFGPGSGVQADYSSRLAGDWFWTAGAAHLSWGFDRFEDSARFCHTTYTELIQGDVTDTSLFGGIGLSKDVPLGLRASLSGTLGYDIVNSGVDRTLTVSRGKWSRSWAQGSDASNTWTGRVNLRLLKPITGRVGISGDLGYVWDMNAQELQTDGGGTGIGVDLSGWRFGLNLAVRL